MKKIPVILALFCISGWSSAALQTVYNPWTGKPDYINSSTGGSGGASGQINSSPQYQIPYYSVAGSSNVLTGSSNFTWNGTSVAVTGNATVSGNVGIGTTAPADKLSVYAGDISVTRPDNTTSQGLYLKTGATYDWGIRSLTGTSDLTFRAEGAAGAVMTLTKVNGNVGIGTAAPGAPLEVQGPYSGSGTLLSMGDNQGTGYNFNFARSSVTGALSIQGEQTGYNNIVLAPTSGNVGIGTTGPTELLSLQSSLPNIKLQITGAGSLVSPLQSGLKFYDYTGTLSGLAGFQDYSYDTLASGYDISTRDTSGAMQHRISVNYQGNVGIGTTSPGEKLQVAGALRVTGNITGWLANAVSLDEYGGYGRMFSTGQDTSTFGGYQFWSAKSDAGGLYQQMTILPSGKLGINDPSPEQLLTVSGEQNTVSAIALIQKNIVGWRIGTAPSSADLHFDATSTDFTGSPAMTISQTGKVGVGLITPVAPLHVFGTSADPSLSADTGVALIGGTNSAQLEIGSKPGSPYSMWMQVKASVNAGASFPLALNPLGGDVGIGIISPTGRLEVNGAGTTDFGATNPTLYLSRVAPYTANNLLRFQGTTATDAFIGTEGTSDDLMFGFVASGVERMRIKSTNGNVGIGTTSPATKLHMSSGTFTIDGNVSPAMTVKGSGAPPDGYALCLSGGSLGHCTTIVGVGGACTCSVP